MTHVEGVGGGIKANVKGCFSVVDQLFDLLFVGHLCDKPSGLQFIINGHISFSSRFFGGGPFEQNSLAAFAPSIYALTRPRPP